jgi:2-keto-3-deoxy-L-rhamnonate aldolase RhmA
MSKTFRQRLQAGETLFGVMLSLPSAPVAEVLAAAGFDWLFVDAEHSPLDAGDLLSILQAADRDLTCLVRIPALEAGVVKRVLDMGAGGIIVPQVETAAVAAEVARLTRYAPAGERGMGLARAHRYGFAFRDYVARANTEVTVVIQVEHVRAVENIDRIVAVAGIDAVFLGPYDLSASLGRPGEIHHPEVEAAIERVTASCRAAGMPLGYFGLDAEAVEPLIGRGYTLICAGVDCVLLGQSARRLADRLRGQPESTEQGS